MSDTLTREQVLDMMGLRIQREEDRLCDLEDERAISEIQSEVDEQIRERRDYLAGLYEGRNKFVQQFPS